MSPRARITRALLAAALLAAAPASAQEEAVEDVQVTARPKPITDSASNEPVTVVTADDLARSSAATLDQLLDRLPAFGDQGVNAAQNDGGYGAAFVDLRGLNFNRTLVLVDGQRFVLSGIRTDEAVDLNNIPLSLIDHVDVLRDGSQPEYGSDAVAGAVNIVTKKAFDGFSATAYQGAAGAGDDATEAYSATWGRVFSAGWLTLDADFTSRDPIRQSNRAWSREPIADASFGGPPLIGGSASPNGHATTSDGALDALLLPGGRPRPYDPATDGYNDSGAQYLSGGLKRYSLAALGRWEITDRIAADAQALFTYRQSDTLLPPQTLGSAGTARYPDGFVAPASNPFNPFGQDVLLQRVLTEAGDQPTHTEGPTLRVTLGLSGPLWDGADWRADYDHGESRLTYATQNSIDLSQVFATLAGTDYFGPDTLTPAQVARIRYADVTGSSYHEDVGRLILHAPVAALPGGPVSLTLGAELRHEIGSTSVSAVTAAGDQAAGDAAATSGGYVTREAYADVDLPLLKDQDWARVLTAEASARYTDTSLFGSFPTWKTVATWAPDDVIRLRAVAGGARRPPAITEAFAGVTANYVPLSDPCDGRSGLRGNPVVNANCRAQGLGPGFTQASDLIDLASGGNPHLRPEASQDATLGAVLTPMGAHGPSLAVDWFSYRIKNAIDSLADTDANYIPDVCYQSVNLSSPLCPLIARAPSGPGAGQISRILAIDSNIGTIKTSGVDVDLSWTAPAANGVLSLDWQATWLLDYRVSRIGTAGFTQYAGTFPGLVAVGSFARVRSNATASYMRGDWSGSWTARLISGAKVLGADPSTQAFTKAGDVVYNDISATWRRDSLTVTAGIDNLLDQAPPTLVDGVTNTDTNTYDVIGRFLYVRCSAAF